MTTKQMFNNRTPEQKAEFVNSKVAYWPKSLVARFAEMEKVIESEREENKKFRETMANSIKQLLK